MKILFVAPRYHPNQHYWADALTKKGHAVDYIVLTQSQNENYEIILPHVIKTKPIPVFLHFLTEVYERITRIKHRKNRYQWPDYRELKKYIKSKNPDVVIVRDISTWLSIQTFFITRTLKIKTILYTQQPLESPRKLLTKILQLITLVPKQRITPVRYSSKNEISKKNRARYIPLVAPTISKKETSLASLTELRILFIGKFNLARKNHLLLLQAIAKLKNRFPLHLTLVGSCLEDDPTLHTLEKFISEHDLSEIVEIKKNIPHKEMGSEYLHHDLFILPSVREPFSISVLEAMAHGLPVIVSDSGGAQYCVENGVNGYVVKANDLSDLVNKMALALENIEKVQAMSEAAISHIQSDHSPEAFHQRILPLLTN